MSSEVPRFAVVGPYAAQWLLRQLADGRRVSSAEVRRSACWLRANGAEGLAQQLEMGWAQLAAAGLEFASRCGPGSADAVSGSVDGTASAEVVSGGAESAAMQELSTQEVARMLEVSTRWVGRLIDSGALSGRKVGRSWLVSRASVLALRDARRAS